MERPFVGMFGKSRKEMGQAPRETSDTHQDGYFFSSDPIPILKFLETFK